jgi:hypothetical protein
MSTFSTREALARLIELDKQRPTGFEIGTDPQWTADWCQAIHQARQALAPKIAMNQAAQIATFSQDAQAVLDAFDRCGDNWPQSLAAALYAAAHRLSHDRRQLAAIATELEEHHG